MSTRVWQGGAAAVAQVQSYTLSGTWEASDTITATIGSRAYTFTAGSTTKATIVDNIVAAWNALSATNYPEFAEITASRSGDALILTADTAGVPFVCTLTTADSGGAADDQRIEGDVVATTGTASTANSGPNNWSTAANWSGGAVPVNSDDVVFENSSVDCLYGLAQSAVTVTTLTIKPSYTGNIGLPRTNATNGYAEYRTVYLEIGATTINAEPGGGRTKINTGTVQTTLNVSGTAATAEDNVPAMLFRGTHASNAVTVNRGVLGVAYFAGETATVATLKLGWVSNQQTDAVVVCGSGVTLTTISKTGGTLQIESNVTTVTQDGGATSILGAATVTTASIDAGVLYYKSSGTITTLNVGNGGTADFRQDSRARTITNANLYSGGAILDPGKTVTWTNGVDVQRAGVGDVTLDLGTHLTVTPSAI